MNDIDIIKKQIKELEDFKAKLERQQLEYPIDVQSKDILLDKAIYLYPGAVQPVGLAYPFDEATEVIVKGKKYLLQTTQFLNYG